LLQSKNYELRITMQFASFKVKIQVEEVLFFINRIMVSCIRPGVCSVRSAVQSVRRVVGGGRKKNPLRTDLRYINRLYSQRRGIKCSGVFGKMGKGELRNNGKLNPKLTCIILLNSILIPYYLLFVYSVLVLCHHSISSLQ